MTHLSQVGHDSVMVVGWQGVVAGEGDGGLAGVVHAVLGVARGARYVWVV